MTEVLRLKINTLGCDPNPDILSYFEFFSSSYPQASTLGKIRILESMTTLLRRCHTRIIKLVSQPLELGKSHSRTVLIEIHDLHEVFIMILDWIKSVLEEEDNAQIVRTLVIFISSRKTSFLSPYPDLNEHMLAIHQELLYTNPVYLQEYEELMMSIRQFKIT